MLNRKRFFSLQLTNAMPRFSVALLFFEDVYGDPGTEAGVTSAGRHFGMDEMSKKVAEIYTKIP